MAEPDDDRASVDRAFAELVAGYHLTAERPEPPQAAELSTAEETTTARGESPALAPRPEPTSIPVPTPAPAVWRAGPTEAHEGAGDEPYVPDPLPPLSRPGTPALVGWTAVLFSAAVVLAAGFGLRLPVWVGWTAVSCFILGSVVLLTQLPRHRPPDAGDGAVL